MSTIITAGVLLAFASCFSGCNQDVDMYTNRSLLIASYTWDNYLDPSRGDAQDLYGSFVYGIMKDWKIKVVVTLYMDGTCTAVGSYYNGGNIQINETGTWKQYQGTLENGTIHLDCAMMGHNTIQDPGSDWWIQVVDGTTIVGVTGPHSDELDTAPTSLTARKTLPAYQENGKE